MRLLVTGASGYLGSELVRQALALGHEVSALVRTNDPPGGTVARLDVRDADAVARLVAERRPDAVIHTAYVQDGDDAWETNVDGSLHVARAAQAVGARLVHLSTDQVFEGERGGYTEEDEPRPIIRYGESKLAAEQAVREAHPEALIVRCALLYGGAAPSRHERLALEAAAGQVAAHFFTDEIRSAIALADAASVLLELTVADVSGLLHLGGPEPLSRLELARAVVTAAGGNPERIEGSSVAESGLVRPRDCSLDSTRLRALVSTPIRSVGEVLRAPARTEEA